MWTALLAAMFVSPPVFTGEASDRAVIWNGFDQQWGYNHRVNRLGDYVGTPVCDPQGRCVAQSVHTAASGTGSDVAQFRSRMTQVHADGVGFLQGATPLHVSDRHGEGQELHVSTVQRIPARGPLADRRNLDVVLGGFDVRSLSDPDKLSLMTISVGDARYESGSDTVAFDVDLTLRMDCDSPECAAASRGVDYEVSVMWTVIAADDQVLVTPVSVADEYAWRRARPSFELSADAHRSLQQVQGVPNRFEDAFVAFRTLSVTLDDEHYVQEWSTALGPTTYDPSSGEASFFASLFFKQWNLESRRRVWSFADRGSADLEADVVLVQLQHGRAVEQAVDGLIDWRANGHAPDEHLSLASTLIDVR